MEEFKSDVKKGLSATPKHLSSKYFYDSIGDELFVNITKLPEYYLTSAENEIFDTQKIDILKKMALPESNLDIIELGVGDGHKAEQLLEPLCNHKDLKFIPIDISQNALKVVQQRFSKNLPEIVVDPHHGEYFSVLKSFSEKRAKVVLFLGSNIGNLTQIQAANFMFELSNSLNVDDKVLLGVDLKKSKEIILPAYNDSKGVTRDFNLNLLERINRELGGDFELSEFDHEPEYDEISGEARSYLRCKSKQKITIGSLNESYVIDENEKIQTEISQKYDDDKIGEILNKSRFKIIDCFKDSNNYFADYLLVKQ